MALHPELMDLLRQEITLEPYQGEDFYGKPVYGPPESFPARVIAEPTLVRDREGVERVSSTTVLIADCGLFDPRSRVTLPDGTQPPVLSLGATPDEHGLVGFLRVRLV